MNNNIFQRVTTGIPQQLYGGNTSSFKIRGTLVEKNDNMIKLSIGGNKIIEAQLKGSIKGEVGDTVAIDKKYILQSKLIQEKNPNQELGKNSNVASGHEKDGVANTLEKYGVIATKENVQLFMDSKASLDKVIKGLDYDTAIKLIKKNVDIEEESLEKLADMVEKTKGEKEGFSFFKLFSKKKNMTLEEAEKTASQLYGNKMGKDFTDVIKALHKAGVEITKGNVEKINNIFAKLENLQDIQEDTIIDSLKNKIEASIDHLYKMKNAITKNVIAVEEKISQFANQAYETMNHAIDTISERELKGMEEQIKALLTASDIEVTEENVRLAKELIRNGMEVSPENMEKVEEIKNAVRELNLLLNHERAAQLLRSGVQIERENILSLVQHIKENIELEGNYEVKDKLFQEEKINNILDTIKNLQNIDEKQLLQLIKKGADFKLSNLQLLTEKGSNSTFDIQELDSSMKTIYQQHVKTLQTLQQLKTLDFDSIARHIGNRYPNTLNGLLHSHQMMENSERVTENPQRAAIENYVVKNAEALGVRGSIMDIEAARALLKSNIPLNRGNLLGLYEINSHVENIRENLSSYMVTQLAQKGATIEEIELAKLSSYIDENPVNRMDINKRFEDIKGIIQNIGSIGGEKDSLLSLLVKNAIPTDLKEVNKLSLFVNNKQQIAVETDKILKILAKSDKQDLRELEAKMKGFLKEATGETKAGRFDAEKTYQQLGKWMKAVEEKGHLLGEAEREAFQKSSGSLRDALVLQSQLSKEDTVLQLPVMMENQLKNLQIYIMDKKKGGRKIDPNDMSILLNFDTNNMGNVNVYTNVNYKKIVLKIGVKKQVDKEIFEENTRQIQEMLKNLGYELKEMSFKVAEENHLFSMVEETTGLLQPTKNFLDIKI
ncbi:hypothetical protein SAMN05446037_101134 [Anaerovirgula multivorans]|uniref:Hook-length control protein FliK n=1 Tax=Anaerovirgula multivorans TaxID=312168 RepID=A0A239EU64_9FIRM|nr:DUF6240 domain-containing protein [Anaerovirgula multivorans]SNS48139.1 hypothetical protein SAMN05446037_101134 [Anaerovirgula multivorans]